MENVSSEKLEAVADFLADNEVDGRFLCFFYNKSLKNKIDVPCYTDLCEETCPFYSKENFLKWIKKPDSEYDITNLKDHIKKTLSDMITVAIVFSIKTAT